MKYIFSFIFLLTAFCARLQAQEAVVAPARFTFVNKDSVYDFGELGENSNATYKFQFKNTGNEALIITNMHCASRNVKITWSENPVKKGKKAVIEVTYISDDNTGSFKNEIFVTSNATPADYPLLHISGTVMPGSFGAPMPGKSAAKPGGRGRSRSATL